WTCFFFFQAEDGIRDYKVTGVQTCALPISLAAKLDTLMINSSSCAAAFTQIAAIEALNTPESAQAVSRMVKVFEHRRNLVVDGQIGRASCRERGEGAEGGGGVKGKEERVGG